MKHTRLQAVTKDTIEYDDEVRPLLVSGIMGCRHNYERVLSYQFTGPPREHQPTANAGDHIILVCPHGCQELIIQI